MSDSKGELTSLLLEWLSPISVRGRRVVLKPDARQSVAISLATIRGVWGRALRLLDENVYAEVFEGVGPPHLRQAMYLFRPSLFRESQQPETQ